MEKHRFFSGLQRFLGYGKASDPLSEQACLALTRSLYARPTALAISVAGGVLSSTLVAMLSANPLLLSLSLLLSAIAILRLVNGIDLARRGRDAIPDGVALAYKIGAFSFALVLGTIASLTLTLDLPAMSQALMVANALGYGIGICAHNAARPRIALGQMALASLPVMIGALIVGGPAAIALAVNIALLFPAMSGITYSVFRTLRGSMAELAKNRELAARMEVLALTDPVTGLLNRVALERRLCAMTEDSAETQPLAIFWVDLDRFKEVNDLRGHQAGDQVLREIAERLAILLDERAALARFAGDEFVVACPVSDRRAAAMLASVIQSELGRPIRIMGERVELGGCIGIAMRPDDGSTADALMQRADLALFEAKAAGRNQIRFFTETMTRNLAYRRDIERELRSALRRDELSVYFQPIVDLETGRIRCFEALVRWFHPTRGEVSPADFIPIAEDCGAIVTLGNWLTTQAARVAMQWPADIGIAVNLSPVQIKAPGAAFGILNAMRDAGLPPERLELEVTENLFLDDSPNTALFIEELSAAGVRFALDDFGTGFSSLGYINRWPFSKIKVDRSFVSGEQAGRKSDAIIRAVSQMGRSLGIDIVAEGLETVEQVASVREAGCTLGQGFHFSRAVPDYQAALLLAAERDGAARTPHRKIG